MRWRMPSISAWARARSASTSALACCRWASASGPRLLLRGRELGRLLLRFDAGRQGLGCLLLPLGAGRLELGAHVFDLRGDVALGLGRRLPPRLGEVLFVFLLECGELLIERPAQLGNGIGLTDVEMDAVITLVAGHVEGAARRALEAALAERRTGMSDLEWWEARAPFLERVFEPERFPTAARVGAAAGEAHNAAFAPQHSFEFGLQRILDGIQNLIQARALAVLAVRVELDFARERRADLARDAQRFELLLNVRAQRAQPRPALAQRVGVGRQLELVPRLLEHARLASRAASPRPPAR